MKARKVHGSQILAMLLSLVLAAGPLMMPVFGEQSSKNIEEPAAVEIDDSSEDEAAEAAAEEDFGYESETEKEGEEEYTEDQTQIFTDTDPAELPAEDVDAGAAVEEIEETNDGQNTLYQLPEEVLEEPAQGTLSTEAKNAVSKDFEPVSIKNAVVIGITDKTYDGSAQTQTLVVKYGEETLEEGRDYQVSYSNNIEVGTAAVIITGIGNYIESIEVNFSIKHVGWYQKHGVWYYADENGSDVTGWKLIDGKWYYFNSNMYYGEEYHIDNAYYRFSAGGAMFTGWYQKTNGNWYYYLPSGKRASGWQLINGKWYFFNDSGIMLTGRRKINGSYYLLSASGAMFIGWYKDSDGDWYYYLPNGKEATGWQQINGKWYYFDEWGTMVTGWQQINGVDYLFTASGAMFTGWYKDSYGLWYYYLPSGREATGWQKIGGKWYYFNTKTCEMYCDSRPLTIAKKGYIFDGNGAMLGEAGGWVKGRNGHKYYAEKGGSLVKGWKKISGKWYYFDTSGYNMYRSGTYKINKKSYKFDKNGVCKNK